MACMEVKGLARCHDKKYYTHKNVKTGYIYGFFPDPCKLCDLIIFTAQCHFLAGLGVCVASFLFVFFLFFVVVVCFCFCLVVVVVVVVVVFKGF